MLLAASRPGQSGTDIRAITLWLRSYLLELPLSPQEIKAQLLMLPLRRQLRSPHSGSLNRIVIALFVARLQQGWLRPETNISTGVVFPEPIMLPLRRGSRHGAKWCCGIPWRRNYRIWGYSPRRRMLSGVFQSRIPESLPGSVRNCWNFSLSG